MSSNLPRIDTVLRYVGSSERVLHMGCTGSILLNVNEPSTEMHRALVEHAGSVVGADIDRTALVELERRGLEVVYMDAQAIPDVGEKLDCIVACELIEHLENPGLFLIGAKQRLKPGGRLILTTPNAFCPVYWGLYTFKTNRHCNPEHTCWFDSQTIEQLLNRTGYRLLELEFVDNILLTRRRVVPPITRMIARLSPDKFLSTMVIVAAPVDTGETSKSVGSTTS